MIIARTARAALAIFSLLTVWPTLTSAEPVRWNMDPDHCTIELRVGHLLLSNTTGHFTVYQGFIDTDAESWTVKATEAALKTASVTTNHGKRDAHLRNADFFDV